MAQLSTGVFPEKSKFRQSIASFTGKSTVKNYPSYTRPLGPMERYTNALHELGLYHSVVLSGIFTPTRCMNLDKDTLYPALELVIREHPSLALLIKNAQTEEPQFEFTKSVNLDQQVHFVDHLTSESFRVALYETYASKKFENIDTTCPWRLIVCPVQEENWFETEGRAYGIDPRYGVLPQGTSRVELGFVFHHSLGDGTAGRMVLYALHSALNKIANSTPETFDISTTDVSTGFFGKPIEEERLASKANPRVSIDRECMPMPLPLEKKLKISLSPGFISRALAAEYGLGGGSKGCWTGSNYKDLKEGYATKIKRVRISGLTMQRLLSLARNYGTTVSYVLTALLSQAVDTAVPDTNVKVASGDCGGVDRSNKLYSKLRVSIARNLRPLMESPTEASMGNYVCSHEFTVPRGSDIWDTAQELKEKMDETVAQGPRNLNCGLLKYAGGMRKFFSQKMSSGKPRHVSCAVSSLLAPTINIKEGDAWTLSDLGICQSSVVADAPFIMSCISFKGGDMMVSFSWCSEILADDIMANISSNFLDLIEEVCA